MSVTTFTISLTLMLTYGVDCSFATGETSKSVDAFLEVLRLTELNCNSIRWCTVRIHESETSRKECCPTCSCDERCFRYGNCCPDIMLRQYLNGTIFTNVQNLTSFVNTIDGINELDITYTLKVESIGDLESECEPSSLYGLSPYRPIPSMYLMVTTCRNQSLPAEIKAKCEGKPELTSYRQLDDIRPVQTLETGAVYRNIHCLECSGDANLSFEKWDVYLFDVRKTRKRFNVKNKVYHGILMPAIQAKQFWETNIIFEPSTKLRQSHPPTTCVNLDIVSYTGNNTDSDEPKETINACQMFYFPVVAIYQKKITAFQNLACMYFGSIDTTSAMTKQCKDSSRWTQSLPLRWKLQSHLLEEIRPNVNHVTDVYANNITEIQSPQCNGGFVFDSNEKRCRKVYCPCGMTTYNTTCVPTFEAIPGISYNIYISVTPHGPIGDGPSNIQYDTDILIHFQQFFDMIEYTNVKDVALYSYKSNKRQIDYRDDLVNIILNVQTEDLDYIHLFKHISKLRQGRQILTMNKTVSVDVSVVDAIHSDSRLITVPRKKRTYRYVQSTTEAHLSTGTGNLIVVNACHFCYLVEVLPGELEHGGFQSYLPGTDTLLDSASLASFGSTRFLTCVEDVLPELREATPNTQPDDESHCCKSLPTENAYYARTSWTTSDYVIVVCSLSVVLTLIAVSLVARHAHQKMTLASTANSTRAVELEMPHIT